MKKESQRIKAKTGELPKDDEVLFFGYKEPLRKFESGYGYQGVLSYSKDLDKVQCHFCGRLFRALGLHIKAEHKLTGVKYKEKVGLAYDTALIGEGTREKYIATSNSLIASNARSSGENVRRSIESNRERRKNGTKRRKMSLEVRNKRGNCPDQLLDIIDKTVKSFGRVPTEEEFKKFHRGRFLNTIKLTYGKWSTAVHKLGLKTHKEIPTDQALLDQMAMFHQTHNRTPRWSDFKRGFLPNGNLYISRFGTMNRARVMAGVPFLIHVGKRVEEWVPNQQQKAVILKNGTMDMPLRIR